MTKDIHPSAARLFDFAETRGLKTKAAIARALNQSDQTISNWEKRGVSKAGAMQAEQVIGCSANWILTGTGLSIAAAAGLNFLNPEGIAGLNKDLLYESPEPAPSPARSFSYPEISEVQAGSPIEAIDLLQPGEGDRHNSDAWAGPHGFWLRVRGESMNRSSGVSFPEGMLILVHPLVEPVSGQFVVAKVDSDVTFKQYVVDAGVRLLKPLNPAYPVQVMDNRWQLVGTVVDAKWPRSAF